MSISCSTPIGSPVRADVDDYPRGYAWGNPRSEVTVLGTLHAVEGDAGLSWCFVRLDEPGNGPEYMHVPMDRVDVVEAPNAGVKQRLEELRAEIRAERISMGELIELQGLAEHIDAGDVELLEWAGVTEEQAREEGRL